MSTIVWLHLGPFFLTPFGLIIALALASANFCVCQVQKVYYRSLRGAHMENCLLLAIPLGILCSHFFHWIFSFGSYSFVDALKLWRGGYSLCGAFLGFLLAAYLFSKARKVSLMDVLDCYSPALALFVALERFGEHFTDQGYGKEIDTGFLQHTLFSMTDTYGAARHAVYRLELVSAIIALIAVLAFFAASKRRKTRIRGEVFRLMSLLIAFPQVVWESLRDDGYLAFGFVRISQVASLLCVLILLFYYAPKVHSQRHDRIPYVLSRVLLALAAAGLAVRQEFAVDTSRNLEASYLLMFLAMSAMAYCVLSLRSRYAAQLLRRYRAKQKKAVPKPAS